MRATMPWALALAALAVAVAVLAATTEDTLAVEPTAWVVTLLVVTFCVVDRAAPVEPDGPEFPVIATGFDEAVEVAGPVLPVLVAVDWALTSPELPDWAVGVIT